MAYSELDMKISAKELQNSVILNVKITGLGIYKMRLIVAAIISRFASWVGGNKFSINYSMLPAGTIRISGNRIGKNTRVYSPSGEDISKHFQAMDIHIEAGGAIVADCKMINLSLDVIAEQSEGEKDGR